MLVPSVAARVIIYSTLKLLVQAVFILFHRFLGGDLRIVSCYVLRLEDITHARTCIATGSRRADLPPSFSLRVVPPALLIGSLLGLVLLRAPTFQLTFRNRMAFVVGLLNIVPDKSIFDSRHCSFIYIYLQGPFDFSVDGKNMFCFLVTEPPAYISSQVKKVASQVFAIILLLL